MKEELSLILRLPDGCDTSDVEALLSLPERYLFLAAITLARDRLLSPQHAPLELVQSARSLLKAVKKSSMPRTFRLSILLEKDLSQLADILVDNFIQRKDRGTLLHVPAAFCLAFQSHKSVLVRTCWWETIRLEHASITSPREIVLTVYGALGASFASLVVAHWLGDEDSPGSRITRVTDHANEAALRLREALGSEELPLPAAVIAEVVANARFAQIQFPRVADIYLA